MLNALIIQHLPKKCLPHYHFTVPYTALHNARLNSTKCLDRQSCLKASLHWFRAVPDWIWQSWEKGRDLWPSIKSCGFTLYCEKKSTMANLKLCHWKTEYVKIWSVRNPTKYTGKVHIYILLLFLFYCPLFLTQTLLNQYPMFPSFSDHGQLYILSSFAFKVFSTIVMHNNLYQTLWHRLQPSLCSTHLTQCDMQCTYYGFKVSKFWSSKVDKNPLM